MARMTRRKFLLYGGALFSAAMAPAAMWKFFSMEGMSEGGAAQTERLPKVEKSFAPLRLNGADVQYPRQLITKDSSSGRTVMWQSKAGGKAVLEYKEAASSESASLPAEAERFKTFDQGEIFLYHASLTNLKPATVYAYRIGEEGGDKTDWCYLATEDGDAFKALLFPDSQCAHGYQTWRKTVETAWENHRDAQFFINMGDLVDNGQQYSQWASWMDGAAGMLERIPLAPVCGNHEDYSLDWRMVEPETYRRLFHLPQNGSEEYQDLFYSFDYGDVHFAVLDSQKDELRAFKPALFTDEYRWLEADLAACTKKWKVVLLHKHLFDYMHQTGITELGKFFMPLFDRYQVDLVFFAHVHTYHRSRVLYAGEPAERGTVYISTGRSGDMGWPGYFPKQDGVDVEECGELDVPNYLTFTAEKDRLLVECFLQDGKSVDKAEIKK